MVVYYTIAGFVAVSLILLVFCLFCMAQLRLYTKTSTATINFSKELIESIISESKLTRETVISMANAHSRLLARLDDIDPANLEDLKLYNATLDTEQLNNISDELKKLNISIKTLEKKSIQNSDKLKNIVKKSTYHRIRSYHS